MTNPLPKERLRVLHVISGDLWAGAEAQAYTLLKHLKPLCEVSAVLLNDGELAKRLRDCNIPVMVLDETDISTFQIFLRLRRHIKQARPDVIHTHRQKENILGALANVTSIGAKSIRTVHGAPEFSGSWKTKLQRLVDEFVGNYLQNAIIAVSDELKEKLSGRYNSDKIHVIYNGVDVKELESNAGITEFKRNHPNKKHIGIIGRLVPVKRVDVFLETAALFARENLEPYHFHVIGDGPLRENLELQASKLDLGNNWVTFHGHRNDIPSCIKSLDAVIMCSDHEGMPMVALEALAIGSDIITHKSIGLADLIKKNPAAITAVNRNLPADYFEAIRDSSHQELNTEASYLYSAKDNAINFFNHYQSVLA